MSDLKTLTNPLRIVISNNSEKIFERVFTHFPINFGRSQKLQVPLEFNFVSRVHCTIVEENGRWHVSDLQSSNGIKINGVKTARHDFDKSTVFSIGPLKVEVEVLPATAVVDEKTPATMIANSFDTQKMLPTERLSVEKPITAAKTPPPQDATVVAAMPTKPMAGIPKEHKPIVRPDDPREVTGISLPMLKRNFIPDLIDYHGGLAQSKYRRLEAVVLWHDQVYDVKEFVADEIITVGPKGKASLSMPTLKEPWSLARVGFETTQCYIPQGKNISLSRGHEPIAMGDLLASQNLKAGNLGYALKFTAHEVAHVDFGDGMQVHLRYVPASKALAEKKIIDAEQAVKQAMVTSGILHGVLALILIFANPPQPPAPKLKNVPERFARLLMEKPKPTPTPEPPKPTPPPKKEIAKKKEPPKKVVKRPEPKVIPKPEPKKIAKVLPKVLEKTNKFPMVVKKPQPPQPPQVKVENLGALAALGALSKAPDTANIVNQISINQNAGGPSKVNTSNFAGTLPTANGKLAMGGGNVKTKGIGVGVGSGYGVQGLKGKAGSRNIAGAIVGEPKLAQSVRTEGLTRAQVMAIVNQHLSDIQHCYERSLLMDPNLAGRMEFEWDISAGGSVNGVRVKRSTVNQGDALAECVKGVFTAMRFPKAKNGETTTPSIGFPFGRL